jgi:hypothetical protein
MNFDATRDSSTRSGSSPPSCRGSDAAGKVEAADAGLRQRSGDHPLARHLDLASSVNGEELRHGSIATTREQYHRLVSSDHNPKDGAMVRILGHHVNKLVLVSIPPIFGQSEPQRCRLVGTEPAGLWLESEHLSRKAFPNTEAPRTPIFVPFTQIAYLIGAPVVPPPADEPTELSRPGRKPLGADPGKPLVEEAGKPPRTESKRRQPTGIRIRDVPASRSEGSSAQAKK